MQIKAVIKHFKLMHNIEINNKIAISVLEDSASSLTLLVLLNCEFCGFVTYSELTYIEHRYCCKKGKVKFINN
jgi:hypothetical protein